MSFFLSISIEQFNTSRRLPVLLTEVQSGNMANSLSLFYSRQGNWENLASVVRDLTTTMPEYTKGHTFRVIVEDNAGNTLYNSFSELLDSSDSELVEGKSEILTDYISGATIGRIVLYIDKQYLKKKTTEYLISALKEKILLTLGAILAALIAAAILSNRLSAPLRRLLKASREIQAGNLITVDANYRTVELAELTESFNHMAGTLKKQKELRQRLIGDLAHEINTPLNIIDLDARGIQDGLVDKTKGLESIRSEIDKLTDLIKDMDWLAETDAGEITISREPCSLSQIIEMEINRWQYKAEKLQIKLIFLNEARHIPEILADPSRIRQALSNLLENCLKYASRSKEILIRMTRHKHLVQVSITDQGPGIPLEETEEIFERLYRLENSRNSNTGGRGLGLSIVKSIMEMHNGKVHVESRPGIGSTFILSFPL